MRVLHWCPSFLAGGGISNSVHALASAQGAAGADVWIASLEHERGIYGALEPSPGVRFARWGGDRKLRWGALELHPMNRRSVRSMRAIAPSAIHVHGEFNPNNWWVGWLWRAPIVLSPHGAFHPGVLERGRRGKRLYIGVTNRVYIAACSDSTR